MNSGRAQFDRNAKRDRAGCVGMHVGIPVSARRLPPSSAACVSRRSGSILGDFLAPFIPNCAGQRQIEQATLRGTKIPCPQRSYNKIHFFFWNQSVAAEGKDGPRRLKFVHGSPENGGSAVATLNDFSASLLYGVFSEIPSDSRCRFHG